MTKHSIYSHKYKEKTVPPGSRPPEDKFPEEDTNSRKSQYLSCVVTHDGVYIHMQHILSHSEDSSDSIYQILASETHAFSSQKRIMTACPYNSKFFHVFRVIERKPDGETLRYKNVLANTAISRWITRTSDEAAATRTMGGYSIKEDIDTHVAQKWSKIVGKDTVNPLEIMEEIIENEDYDRPDIRYPDCFTGEPTDGRKRLVDSDNEDQRPSKRTRHD